MFDAQDFAARLSTREDRWSLLKDFIAEWHGPLERGDGYSAAEFDAAEQRLGLKLPLALRECYSFAGKFLETFSVDPYAFTPLNDLGFDEDDPEMLWLFAETQADIDWGTCHGDLTQDDPPVYVDGIKERGAMELSNTTYSEFVLQVVVYQTVSFFGFCGNAAGKEDTAEIAKANFTPLALPAWPYPVYPSQLYGRADVLVELEGGGKDFCRLSVAARTETALRDAVKLFDLGWDALTGGVPVPAASR